VVACLGLAVDLYSEKSSVEIEELDLEDGVSERKVFQYIKDKMEYLCTSRPTAVNLFNAMKELEDKMQTLSEGRGEGLMPQNEGLRAVVKDYAEFALRRDREDNQMIGKHGADAICGVSDVDDKQKKVKIEPLTMMTICNTGSLATSDYGTALGVVRAVHERQRLGKVVALETRPYNQGSRLTAYELVVDQLPNATLICDSMAAAMMKLHGVDAIVVGADRVCANGDTANKIGTYSLAVLAHVHNVPFYVAAPITTLDPKLPSGDDVVIEERPPNELLSTSRAPKNIAVWNPAFDVTPAKYIAGIITEKGVIRPNGDGAIDVVAFLQQHVEETK